MLGCFPSQRDLVGRLDLVAAVLRGRDVLGRVGGLAHPHGDVLPVVGVARVEEVGDDHVLLEVVPVQVDAPAVVAISSP